MKDFIVIQADHKEDWNGNYGPMKTYSLKLEEVPPGSGLGHEVEINQKPTTAPPAPGETLTGDITPNKNPDFPPRFKKAQKEGFSGSGGGAKSGSTFKPRDPSEIAGARHAHNLLVAAHSFEPLSNSLNRTDLNKALQERLDDLEAFACVLDEKTAAISDAAREAKPSPKEDDSSFPF